MLSNSTKGDRVASVNQGCNPGLDFALLFQLQDKRIVMARNRMIKVEFWASKTLNRVSLESRLTFIGMWNFADDYGVLLNSNRRILGDVYPLDESMTEKKIENIKQELIGVGLLVPCNHEGQDYLIITGWEEHQTVPNRSKRANIKPDLIKSYLDSNESKITLDLCKEKEKQKEKGKIERERKSTEAEASREFELFWKTTRFPKRKQDTKGDMKKKFIACRKAGISSDDILLSSNVFADHHRGDKFALGMRKFLDPDTVKEYLTEDVTQKGKVERPLMTGGNEQAFREAMEEIKKQEAEEELKRLEAPEDEYPDDDDDDDDDEPQGIVELLA